MKLRSSISRRMRAEIRAVLAAFVLGPGLVPVIVPFTSPAAEVGATAADATAPAPLSRIRIADDGRGFVNTAGARFTPWGVNYYRPGTGWAPQVWRQFDPVATAKDFARLQELGANCVRVFLTFGSFYNQPGVLDEAGVRKLETFLDLAAAHGLYVHPTGPDHWEGLPDWAREDRISSESVLAALEDFWRLLATRLRTRSNLFAYDLLNEPEVPWNTPALRTRWNQWLARRYANHADLTNAWKRADVPALGAIESPPKEDALMDPRLLDFQRFREDVAEEWTRRQAAAIRAADPRALVTVGLIQWSVPVVLAHVGHYSAFRPDRQAPHLDFVSFHFYPLENGAYRYGGAEDEARNLGYLDAVTRDCARFGKPVVLAEFGWHGGGRPKAFPSGPPGTEDQQADWCRQAVETTRDRVAGWLNWGFHDHPQAGDVSEFTGLLTAEGTTKAWGREFARLAATLSASPGTRRIQELPGLPSMDWDRQITSRAAADAFRSAYLAVWIAGRRSASTESSPSQHP